MKRLIHVLRFEGKTYIELDDNPIGRKRIEKVFYALMLLEKEICMYPDVRIDVDICGVVHIHGLPEELQQKINDSLDNAALKRFWRWVNY